MDRVHGIGIDVGGTKILLVALGDDRRVLDVARVDSPGNLAGLAGAIAPALATVVGRLADVASPIALGLALPGLVDARGVLRSAPNLGAQDVTFDLNDQLAEPLVAALGGRAASRVVALENDATAAAMGEHRLGAGSGHDDVLVISLGTGIGAGFVAGGRLIKGARGYAGEIGHMVIDPNGPQCSCGRRGCWEQLASGSALAAIANRAPRGRLAQIKTTRAIRGEDVVDAARDGDASAIELIGEFAHWVAIGLVNATEIFDPSLIVLGGGLVTASDVVLDPIRRAFERLSRPAQERRGSQLVPATLGERAAAIGVALVAMEQ